MGKKTKAQKKQARRDFFIQRAQLKAAGLWREQDPLSREFSERVENPKA